MSAIQSLLTTAQAARKLRVSARRVQALLKEGRIAGAKKIGRDWLVPNPPAVTRGSRGPLSHARKK